LFHEFCGQVYAQPSACLSRHRCLRLWCELRIIVKDALINYKQK
jgi:hypothetical protein